MGPRFQDRFDAGRFLAPQLRHHANEPNTVVVSIPRGGVPVGFEVVRELNVPLDLFVVRKLGMPGREELAIGAIASGGVRVLNDELVARCGLSPEVVDALSRAEEKEIERHEAKWRGGREPLELRERHVILVDDGLAMGASMRAAVLALRQRGASGISVAVPIGSRETCEEFCGEVEELICAETPEPFFAVGTWYSNYLQVSDEEVRELLDRAAHLRRAQQVRARPERVAIH